MSDVATLSIDSDAAVARAVGELLRAAKWGSRHYINLPLIYPSGSFITVRVEATGKTFRVDDGGFAYRELESVGKERSFAKAAAKAAQAEELSVNNRVIFVDVPAEHLMRAICDVGIASRDVTERIYRKLADDDESEIEERLTERLERIFGRERIDEKHQITGSSTTPWNVSAILHADSGLVVFQAVGMHQNSINKASTAFHDLQDLPKPPKRIAVVRDTQAFGAKIALLAQAGRVIEDHQPDAVFLRAAA